jgi:hypothetical protein
VFGNLRVLRYFQLAFYLMTEQPARFETKIAIVVREDLASWQKLNMTAFLAAAIAADAPESIGEHYEDADGTKYLATFGQPAMVFAGTGAELTRTRERALARGVVPAIFTEDLFATGNDADNRAAVRAVHAAELHLTGLAFRTARRDADKITKGLRLHG